MRRFIETDSSRKGGGGLVETFSNRDEQSQNLSAWSSVNLCVSTFSSVTQMFLRALNKASINKPFFLQMLRCELYVKKGGHHVFEKLFKWSSLLIVYICISIYIYIYIHNGKPHVTGRFETCKGCGLSSLQLHWTTNVHLLDWKSLILKFSLINQVKHQN